VLLPAASQPLIAAMVLARIVSVATLAGPAE
jgi:hypothetical protein